MEHPYYGSWGYQATGLFAPTARYGRPQASWPSSTCSTRGIGVILDWVPSHFATDEFGLGEFDGTHLYEHEDPRRRVHPDWGSYEFNYARHEVTSFLVSSAWFWLDRYHVDGLRVDAVASMLYLDYSRGPGQWIAEPLRRPGEPRRRRLPPPVQRLRPRALRVGADRGRGVDCLAGGVETDRPEASASR